MPDYQELYLRDSEPDADDAADGGADNDAADGAAV